MTMVHLLKSRLHPRSNAGLAAMLCAAVIAPVSWAGTPWTETVLYQFSASEGSPNGSLIQGSDGNFYGTTTNSSLSGIVFRITPQGTLTALHTFAGAPADGAYSGDANSLVQGPDGNFYGSTWLGGANDPSDGGDGTLYSVSPAGQYTLLYSFASCGAGAAPSGLVLGADGNYYGVEQCAGPGMSEASGVFRMTPTGTVSLVWTPGNQYSILPNPNLLSARDGNLYGIAQSSNGSQSTESVFKIDVLGNASFIATFPNTEGGPEFGPLTQDAAGNLYGTAFIGGPQDSSGGSNGSIFKMAPDGTVSVLHYFSGAADGCRPIGGVIVGLDGNLYGTAYGCGPGGVLGGTVYQLSTSGTGFTLLYSFSESEPGNGFEPIGGLVQGGDGSLYGLTWLGGGSVPPPGLGNGVVFKLTPPAPQWQSPPTPANGASFTLTATLPFNLALGAVSPVAVDSVAIAAGSLPAGSALSATPGNPAAASFSWTPAQAGTYTAAFTATDQTYPTLNAGTRMFQFNVVQRGTAMTASPVLLNVAPLQLTLEVEAALDATGPAQPLSGKTITFTAPVLGLICAAVTDASGNAKCMTGLSPLLLSVLGGGFTATFEGDGAYLPSSANGYLVQ